MKHTLAGAAAKVALGLEGLLRPATRVDPEAARSVLILEYMLPLGSCVHMTPVFEALKTRRPELTVTVATRGLGLGLLRYAPFIDHLIETPDPLVDVRGAAAALTAALKARGLEPDCCLTGASDQRTKIALLGALACRGWRGGFTVLPAVYQRPLVYDWGQSLIANNLRVAELVGARGELLEPKVFYTAADAARARELSEPLRVDGRPLLVAVTQNSGGQRTGWHAERWAKVIQHAATALGYSVAYVGTPGDVGAIEALRAQAGGIGTNLAGQTNVAQLAALLAGSDLLVTLDTGTMHVGRAVGVPMAVLGPSWQKPLEWLPLGKPQVRILRGEDRVGVPEGYQLDEISVEDVTRALDDLSLAYPASAEARQARVRAGLSSVDLLAGQPRVGG